MQTAVLDSFAILPLVISLLVQGVAVFFLFRVYKNNPEKIPDPVFFKLATIFIGILGLSCILSILFPSLLIFSSGILFASILLLVFLVLFQSYIPPVQEKN